MKGYDMKVDLLCLLIIIILGFTIACFSIAAVNSVNTTDLINIALREHKRIGKHHLPDQSASTSRKCLTCGIIVRDE